MFKLFCALLAGLVTSAGTFAAASRAIPASPMQGVRMEILTLPSDPPGEIRQAPGGGRVLTPAVLFTPEKGENTHGPAIVMVEEGPGANPAKWGQPGRWAAERLAAQGYTVLSLYSHMVRGYPLFAFDETAHEINAALTALEARGYEDMVLAGYGYGAIAAANYLATHPDPLLDSGGEKRVKATVMFAPLTELRAYPRANLAGPGYEDLVARTRASVASGRGLAPANHTLEIGGGPGAGKDAWFASGDFVAPAEHILNYFGPEAAERNRRLLTKLTNPTLILAGARDATTSLATLELIRSTASPAAPVDLKAYPAGDHAFTGLHDQAVSDVSAWLKARGLGPTVRITTRIVDAATDDGRVLPGLLYMPDAGVDPNRPALLLVHGRSGDIIQSSTHWMAWRFAQRGYAVLVPSMRISGATGIQVSNLAETRADLAHWVDTLSEHGFKRVIATGHSNGGIWISNYVAATHDPRIVGMAYFAPTVNSREHQLGVLGAEGYAATAKEARAAIDRGDGATHIIGLLTANGWWDSNGPHSRTMHSDRVKEFSLPGLAIIGRKDSLFIGNDFMQRFEKNYAGKLDVIWYENGSHGLRESKFRLVNDVDEWVRRTFVR